MTTMTASRSGGTMGWNFLLRMKLWQKFLGLGLVALAMTAYPLYVLVKNAQDAIDVVRAEQAGLPLINGALDLAKAFQDHRGSSSYLVLGDAKRGEPQPKHAAAIDEAVSRLDALVRPVGDAVMSQRMASITKSWIDLKANIASRKIDQRRVTEEHIAVIRVVLRLVEDVTAWSTIDLDPDAAAYYTFRATLIELPQLSEAIGQLRSPVVSRLENIAQAKLAAEQQGKSFNLEAALRDAYRPSDRANIADTVQDVEGAARRYDDNMRKAIAASPEIGAATLEQVNQIRAATQAALSLVRREILGKDMPEIDTASYLKLVTVPREAVQKAATQASLPVKALEQRSVDTRNTLVKVLLGELAVLLLGVALAVLTVRNITGSVAGLQASVNKIRDGDFDNLRELDSKDELGDLGREFNKMGGKLKNLLQEQVAAQRAAEDNAKRAEAENETLNNSVISILQAVNQLSQRDLTVRAPVTQDIIGTVSDSLNLLTDETSKVLAGVNLIAAQVAEGSGKVKDQADLMSKTAAADHLSVGQMIESIASATQAGDQVAALAEQSNRHAEQATQATLGALEAVNGTVKGMESIRETIAETEKRIKRLGERSQEITGIVNLINTISERTHVLALNASMQAAVAGEAGRGFAVVAEEVQRLAESSRNATQQIGTLVGNIQLETNETISTVNRTIGQVVQGSEQAHKAGEKMRHTQQMTGELVAQVKRIAESSEQQKAVSAGLLRAVNDIGQGAERTARQLDTQNRETESLLQSARRLVESVAVFKLPQAA